MHLYLHIYNTIYIYYAYTYNFCIGVDVRGRVYTMGKTSNLVGHSVQSILKEKCEVYTMQGDGTGTSGSMGGSTGGSMGGSTPGGLVRGSLILIDRTVDLVTPTMHGINGTGTSTSTTTTSTTSGTPSPTPNTNLNPSDSKKKKSTKGNIPVANNALTFAHHVVSTIPRRNIVNSITPTSTNSNTSRNTSSNTNNTTNNTTNTASGTEFESPNSGYTLNTTTGYDVALLNAPLSKP